MVGRVVGDCLSALIQATYYPCLGSKQSPIIPVQRYSFMSHSTNRAGILAFFFLVHILGIQSQSPVVRVCNEVTMARIFLFTKNVYYLQLKNFLSLFVDDTLVLIRGDVISFTYLEMSSPQSLFFCSLISCSSLCQFSTSANRSFSDDDGRNPRTKDKDLRINFLKN